MAARGRAPALVPAPVLLLFLLLRSTVAHASGFLLYDQSAAALGRASAVSASAADPSAAWFNPAGLAFQPVWGATLSGMLFRPGTSFTPADGRPEVDSFPRTYLLPAAYGHAALGARVQVGIGVNVPFGLAIYWPEGWLGQRYAISTKLYALALNPSVAFRVNDRVSVAAGVSAVSGEVQIATGLLPEMGEGRADLAGSAWGGQVNVGLLVRVRPEKLHLAATYRSRVRLAFSGHAAFSPENPAFGAVDQGAKAVITLPDIITLGALLRPSPALDLSAEIGQTLWSTFDRLAIDFSQPNMRVDPIERGRRNPITARAGVEWRPPRTALALRGGATFDQSTVTPETIAPSGPDSDRVGLCGGLGYRLGHFGVDLGYMFSHYFPATAAPPPPAASGVDRAQSPAGTYRSRAHQLALSLTVSSS